jgi:hypothetical protein
MSRRFTRDVFSACAFLVFLGGCAGFLPPQHEAVLENTPPCCKDLAGLPYEDLAKGQSKRVFVGPDRAAYVFPQGKSFFLAYRLIREEGPATLVVRTYAQNMTYNPNGHVFVPRVTYLSARHEIVSSISPEFIVTRPLIAIGESAWQVTLFVPPDVAYVVIHTGEEERSKVMRMPDSDQAGGYLYTRTGPAGEVEVALSEARS